MFTRTIFTRRTVSPEFYSTPTPTYSSYQVGKGKNWCSMTDCRSYEEKDSKPQGKEADTTGDARFCSQAQKQVACDATEPHRQVSPMVDGRHFPPPPYGADRPQNSPPRPSNEVLANSQQPNSCLCIASPVTMEEARLAASRMKQLSSHYQNATLNSPTPIPSPALGPPLTKFTAIAPAPEGRPRPRPERASHPAITNAARYPIPIAAAPPKSTHEPCPPSSVLQPTFSMSSPVPTEQGYYASQSSQMQEAKYQDNTESTSGNLGGDAEQQHAHQPFAQHTHNKPHATTYGVPPAHRRSLSKRAAVFLHSGQHHFREDSAGLDILSAAVEGLSQDELAAVAGSGQKPSHKRDGSLLSAFGSLGSVEFKNLLNNVSATPDRNGTHIDSTSSRDDIGNATPSEATLAPASRAPTPPTPMISNINREAKGIAKNKPKKTALSIPVFQPNSVQAKVGSCRGNVVPSSVAAGNSSSFQPSGMQPSTPRESNRVTFPPKGSSTVSSKNAAGIAVSKALETPAQTKATDIVARQECVRPLKKQHRRHRSSFSNLFNGAETNLSTAPHQRHTRDPSETSKMLMQIERKIDQEVAHKVDHNAQGKGTIASPESLSSPHQQLTYTRHPLQTVHVRPRPLFPARVCYTAAPIQIAGSVQVNAPASYPYPNQPMQNYYPPVQQHGHINAVQSTSPPALSHASSERRSMPPPPVCMNHPPPPEASPLSKKLMGHSSPIGGPSVSAKKISEQGQKRKVMVCKETSVNDDNTANSGKRVRRKCTVAGCENRVVQGGRCITHGAKRKQCGHPGCTKNVKKAGMCSTHGPARKRCEAEGCNKVAVQGGRCISHGARKKLCSVQRCEKQGIINGYCKKHYDEVVGGRMRKASRAPPASYVAAQQNQQGSLMTQGAADTTPIKPKGNGSIRVVRISNDVVDPASTQSNPTKGKSSHKRGLSVFYDMSAVEAITSEEPSVSVEQTTSVPGSDSLSQKKKAHERGLSIFSDENVSNAIISGALNDAAIS